MHFGEKGCKMIGNCEESLKEAICNQLAFFGSAE